MRKRWITGERRFCMSPFQRPCVSACCLKQDALNNVKCGKPDHNYIFASNQAELQEVDSGAVDRSTRYQAGPTKDNDILVVLSTRSSARGRTASHSRPPARLDLSYWLFRLSTHRRRIPPLRHSRLHIRPFGTTRRIQELRQGHRQSGAEPEGREP